MNTICTCPIDMTGHCKRCGVRVEVTGHTCMTVVVVGPGVVVYLLNPNLIRSEPWKLSLTPTL